VLDYCSSHRQLRVVGAGARQRQQQECGDGIVGPFYYPLGRLLPSPAWVCGNRFARSTQARAFVEFIDPIANCITLGKSGESPSEVAEAAKMPSVLKITRQLPDSGVWQRIATTHHTGVHGGAGGAGRCSSALDVKNERVAQWNWRRHDKWNDHRHELQVRLKTGVLGFGYGSVINF
jgi:hypothetical protein